MSDGEIQPGAIYLVETQGVLQGASMRVRALRNPPELPGWWECESLCSGRILTLPETANWQLEGRLS